MFSEVHFNIVGNNSITGTHNSVCVLLSEPTSHNFLSVKKVHITDYRLMLFCYNIANKTVMVSTTVQRREIHC